MPEYRYAEDIKIMKQNNINAIRTSHYPNPSRLYELCDEWGIYVMDETDMETHGVRNKNCPGDHPQWTGAVVDRVSRMVELNKNHPCIIIWSLGNEAGDGSNFKEMKSALLKLDTTRPVHYEGDHTLEVSDFVSLMYPTVEVVDSFGNHEDVRLNMLYRVAALAGFLDPKEFTKEQYAGKPIILCEFAHALENSLGNFDEFTNRFEKYKNVCGGYIWDFVDQSLRIKDETGQEKWLYGGDFGEKEGHTYFCANGIVFADRSPHPSLFEAKKDYQYIKAFPVDLYKGVIDVQNHYVFKSLADLELYWEVLEDGIAVSKGTVKTLGIGAGKSKHIAIPFELTGNSDNAENHLALSFRLKKKTPWADKGHEVAWEQMPITPKTKPAAITLSHLTASDELNVKKWFDKITVSNGDFTVVISKKTGAIVSLDYGFGELIKSPLVPNFWRAYTDNDRNVGNFAPPTIQAIIVEHHCETMTLKRSVKKVKVDSKSNHHSSIQCEEYKKRHDHGLQHICRRAYLGRKQHGSHQGTGSVRDADASSEQFQPVVIFWQGPP